MQKHIIKKWGQLLLTVLLVVGVIFSLTPSSAQAATDLGTVEALMDGIAANYTDNSNEWVIMDVAAYEDYNSSAVNITSDAAKQTYINYAISVVEDYTRGTSSADAEYAKAILALQSIGIDPQTLFTVNSSASISAVNELKNTSTNNVYNAPYILHAYRQGNYNVSAATIQGLFNLIENSKGANCLFGYTWGGVTYDSCDAAGMVLAAITPYADDYNDPYGVKAQAQALQSEITTALSGAQDATTGSFGDANTDAMVIIGLVACGINPDTDDLFVKNGNSLLSALLSYTNATDDGFLYYGSENELATEQGFRALIAAANIMSSEEAYNIYDFSANILTPGRAAGVGGAQTPSTPVSTTNIIVSFSLQGRLGGPWISGYALTISSDATVYNVITQVFGDLGYTYVSTVGGYLKSVTTPTGVSLGEFDYGPNSGWLYKVNGILPQVGLAEYTLTDGDIVLLYYTEDWTLEEAVVSFTDKSKTKKEDELIDAPVFTDIKEGHWAEESVYYLGAKGIVNGKTENTFAPAEAVTKTQLLTMFARISKEEIVDIQELFADMDLTSQITREDLAVMLVRFARYLQVTLPATYEAEKFADVATLQDEANTAITFLRQAGIVEGKGNNLFAPKDIATRAETAKMLALFLQLMEE